MFRVLEATGEVVDKAPLLDTWQIIVVVGIATLAVLSAAALYLKFRKKGRR